MAKLFTINMFKKVKFSDGIKTNFCKENNINLMRIKYTQFNIIENILANLNI